jgi:hypothetical protein
MREVIRPFNARMSVPLRPEIRNLYADGDTVIVFFDARGTARDGKPYANTYAWEGEKGTGYFSLAPRSALVVTSLSHASPSPQSACRARIGVISSAAD